MKAKGFTLIELMIVIAIIGILASIAIPAFTGESGGPSSPKFSDSARHTQSTGEQCVGGVKVMVNRNGDSYQLKDARGNGIAC